MRKRLRKKKTVRYKKYYKLDGLNRALSKAVIDLKIREILKYKNTVFTHTEKGITFDTETFFMTIEQLNHLRSYERTCNYLNRPCKLSIPPESSNKGWQFINQFYSPINPNIIIRGDVV